MVLVKFEEASEANKKKQEDPDGRSYAMTLTLAEVPPRPWCGGRGGAAPWRRRGEDVARRRGGEQLAACEHGAVGQAHGGPRALRRREALRVQLAETN